MLNAIFTISFIKNLDMTLMILTFPPLCTSPSLPSPATPPPAPASVRLPTESTDGNLPAETFGAYGEKAGEGQVSGPYGEKGGEGWRGERRGENLFSRRR